ncbi:MAG TPA: phosphate ABC transporter permease PstA [Bellilinea sp.]|nr:phosphate ABC transporter permease PstA [Bellilinea sp.]
MSQNAPIPTNPLADTPELSQYLHRRNRRASAAKALFFLATSIGIVMLAILLVTVVDQAFGLVAIENKVDPATLADRPIADLSVDELSAIIRDNLSKNRVKTIERAGTLETQPQSDLVLIIEEDIVKPKVVKSYSLIDSLFRANAIRAEAAENYPEAKVEFRNWLNRQFLTNTMASDAELAGVRSALKGSLLLIAITVAFAFPIGVGAAIYLEEYARNDNWINRIIQTNIDNLAGVPSIVYGILGLAVFVRSLEPITSGALFGVTGGNGRTILSAGLTMGLLVLPILIINAQEAIRAVPNSLRQASFGLGATRWQTIWFHVLPNALPGILTGTILAISRAIGETAPLIVVGASTFITSDPSGPFSNFTALPIQIYNWTTRPQDTFRNIAAAAILVLLGSLLTLNAIAILLRNRFTKRV